MAARASETSEVPITTIPQLLSAISAASRPYTERHNARPIAQSFRASTSMAPRAPGKQKLTVSQRSAVARVARQQHAAVARRTFITPTAVRSAELVQDLYLRELKNYKTCVPLARSTLPQSPVRTTV
ncbi:MAG: hypothetical protein INR71_04795 [Terriglobus roseus]|nr:hypothetical protein [Terriglobus roseus]